ncbi:hypothetical protein SK224_01865 [Microbacterium sp. BG28]|uniref:hypothetical protein n=1 Tax=unclassified Microbacterium TaxID=2609290 RepID=UPI002790A755|nr:MULTISPECIES: hypothetical protein [unclassified Microbacterium]MDQ1205767.1 ABC-type transport system involved in cytochrome bd biosynthesis fused ATPase/permease subunit [Microbacterium sp. SORGH_AS_0862]MDY0827863.1 hypothetical protein [Microbacterium sp. BG28]
MSKNTLWTVLAVIASIVIGWFLVNLLFSVIAFVFKLVIVAAVALVVFLVLRSAFSRSGD